MSEALDRIRAMLAPSQQTWDLSPNDVEALQELLLAAEAGFAVSAQLEEVRAKLLEMVAALDKLPHYADERDELHRILDQHLRGALAI